MKIIAQRDIQTFSMNSSVSGQLPPRKIAPWLRLGFGLGLALELGLGDNFPRGQLP